MTLRATLPPAIVLLALSFASGAGAQPARDASPAETAFRDGRAAMAAGDLARACARFAESQRLEPAAGTLLNLAECLDKRGLTASAASTYDAAAKGAALRGRADWEKLSRERAEVLKKLAPKVTLVVAASEVAGTSLSDNGAAVQPNVELLVDPGAHTVQATSSGQGERKPWSKTFDVKNGDTLKISVPRLTGETSAVAPPTEPADAAEPGSGRRMLGLVVGGVGIAGIGVGAVTGILAFQAHDDAVSKCAHYPDQCPADGSGTTANDRARTMATISTIGFIAGGALLAGGAVLFFTAPRSATGVRVTPAIDLAGAPSVTLDGRF